jgi:hypothetical protein
MKDRAIWGDMDIVLGVPVEVSRWGLGHHDGYLVETVVDGKKPVSVYSFAPNY